MSTDLQSRLARLSPEKRALLQRRLNERGADGVSDSIPQHLDQTSAPLSPAQQQMWLTIQVAGGEAAYHMMRALHLAGALDPNALTTAIHQVFQRHAIYRTVISERAGHLQQEVRREHPLLIEVASVGDDWQDHVKAFVLRPFVHGREPLLRITLLRRGDHDHLLVLVIHHLISDGWSMDLLLSEIASAYNLTVARPTSLFPTSAATKPTPKSTLSDRASAMPSFYDVARWLGERAGSDACAGDLAYWTTRLGGPLPVLSLPADHPRPRAASGRGFTLTSTLPAELVEEVASFARARGVTVFMVMLAAYQVLLHRLSGQTDLLVGTPVAGRQRLDLERIHGFLVNTVVVRGDLSGDPSFAAVLTQIKAASLEALQHQEAPFENVVTALKPERTAGVHPIFQTMFLMLNDESPPRFIGVETARTHIDPGTAMFDLSLEVIGEGRSQVCYWEATSDLFEPATIRAWMGHYQTLLHGAVTSPEAAISTLTLLSAQDRDHLLYEFNNTATTWSGLQPVHRLVEQQARRTPTAIAAMHAGKELDYRTLDRRANHLARILHLQGIAAGARVAICVDRSFELLVAVLGVLKAGCAYVPLDPSYPLARRMFMLTDARIAGLIAQRNLARDLAVMVPVINADGDDLRLEAAEPPMVADDPAASAYIIYTSGSTGQPKGIDMPHEPLANLIRWQLTTSRHGQGRTLQFSPIGFDVSFQEIFSTWAAGGTLVLINDDQRRDPDQLLRHLLEQRIARIFLPFVALQQLAEAAGRTRDTLAALREVVTAGEQLQITPALIEWFARMPGCTLHNHYGPSETHVVTCHDLTSDPRTWPTLPPIGSGIANARTYILGRDLQPVPVGVTGELFLGGPVLAKGYLGRDDLTAARFVADPFVAGGRMYRTGDLARWRADGVIEFLGRADDQVKIRGFRIELGEIENALGLHPAIQQQVVVAPGDGAQRRLVAYLVPKPGHLLDHVEIRSFLRLHVPDYMVPTRCIEVSSLPTTPSGKIDRKALPAVDDTNHVADTSRSPAPIPSISLHFLMIQVWEDVLGIHGVRLDDDFFAIGGNSLLAYRMMTALTQHVGRRLPMAALFNSPTILGLCDVILSDLTRLDRPVLQVQAGASGKNPLFFLHGDYLGGGYYCVNFARLLGAEVPFYAVVPKPIDLSQPIPTLETLAAHYVREIRAVSPIGPYRLGGFCIGGMIAFEMARQLREQGQEVALLTLVDSQTAFPIERFSRRLVRYAALVTRMDAGRQLALFTRLNQQFDRLSELSLSDLVKVALTKIGLCAPPAGGNSAKPSLVHPAMISAKAAYAQMTAYVWAAWAYRPKPIAMDVHLVVSDELAALCHDPTFGWAGGPSHVHLHRIPGGHLEAITRNLPRLAELLRPLICGTTRDEPERGETLSERAQKLVPQLPVR